MDAKQRAVTYGLLARALAFPGPELKALCAQAVSGELPLPPEVVEVARLGARVPLEILKEQYITLFGHVMRDVPPYETQYGNAHIFQQANELADIAGFYKAFGLRHLPGEREDHIAVELEFMAYLTLREACAQRECPAEGLQALQDGEGKFLRDHLGRWAPLLGRMIAARTSSEFYGAVGRLLDGFVSGECARAGVQPEGYREVDVQRPDYEPEGGCFSCGFAEQCFPGAQEELK